MCERRVLISAVITDIHDSTVAYPSCIGCYSKLLVDPTTGRFHCIRCGTSYNKSKVQWRYRLVMSVADGTSIGTVVVFGRTLDGFFGKTASDFHRSLDDLEQTGYPASSLLSEALLRTFHGKYFYFGFKLTGSNDTEESPTLKHILKADISLFNSQLDCSTNFENSHTLAYQMLACSDAVYATVTDHMRLLVRQLRNQNQSDKFRTPVSNQSEEIRKPASNQSYKPLQQTSVGRSCGNSLCSFRGSLSACKTVSFGGDQESVRFSFEGSTNQSDSVHKIIELSGKRSPAFLPSPLIVRDQLETLEAPFVYHNSDSESKESFLAASELNTKNYVSFDTFTEDGESCVPLDETVSKLICPLPDSFISMKQNSRTDSSFLGIAGNHGNTFSHISVTHRLDFENQIEIDFADTSKRIDDELKRREIVSFHKNISQKAMKQSVPTAVTNTAICHQEKVNKTHNNTQNDNVKETKQNQVVTTSEGLQDISNDFYSFDSVISNSNLQHDRKRRDILLDTDLQKNHNCNVISEIRMPESEDLDAFFDSQFDGIIFTQEVGSMGITTEENKDECVFKQHGNVVMGIGKEKITSGEVDIDLLTAMDAQNVKVSNMKSGNTTVSPLEDWNMEADKENIQNNLPDLPESEEIGDFLDSFEECLLEQEQFAETCPEVVSESSKTDMAKPPVSKINVVVKSPELDEESNAEDESDVASGDVPYVQKNDFKVSADNHFRSESKTTIILDFKLEINDDSLLDKSADVQKEEELFSTFLLPFVEDDNEEAGCALDAENERINEYVIICEDLQCCADGTDSGKLCSSLKTETTNTASKVTNVDNANKTELVSEHEENDSGELEEFFAEVSNYERLSLEIEAENTRHETLLVQQKYDIDQVCDKIIEKTDTVPNTDSEDEDSDLKQFFHELSQISLDAAKKNAYLENSSPNNDSFLLNSQDEAEMLDQADHRIHTHNDAKQSEEENNSILDKTPDFEHANLKIKRFRAAFNSVPFYSEIKIGNKLQIVSKPDHPVDSEAAKFEKAKSETLIETDEQAVTSQFTVNAAVPGSSVEKLKSTVETLVNVKDLNKSSKNNSSLVNYSLDLFEMSGQEIEQNSEYILTVCTPSFTSKAVPDNSSVNEVIFEDSPLGTSTPGLDDCVVVDSQDAASFLNMGSRNNVVDCDDGKRKVKFDKRLRRISSCRVMDIRMKLNESPLATIPQVALKSCLKLLKEPYHNKVAETETADVGEKWFVKSESGCSLSNMYFTGITNSAEKKSVYLDGSGDLFGDSFDNSAKETCGSTDYKCISMEQNIDNVRIYDSDNDNTSKEEGNRLKTDVADSEDLWLNESSDSLVFEAVSDDVPCKLGQGTDDLKSSKHKSDSDNMNNVKSKVNFTESKPETPDLFLSQENFDFGHLDRKSSVSVHLKRAGLQENQRNRQMPCKVLENTYKGSSKQGLKFLVINTPGCDSDIVPKQRASLLKSQNQSSLAAKNSGNKHSSYEMKENISVGNSPDIFGDSVEELDRIFVCDKNSVVKKSSVLCKKLFF